MTAKSNGQITYEKDVERRPKYPDGSPRKKWHELGDVERWSWDRPMRELTKDEQAVIGHLKDAWNTFLALPRVHREEVDEFRHKLHDLQRMILSRPNIEDPVYPQRHQK